MMPTLPLQTVEPAEVADSNIQQTVQNQSAAESALTPVLPPNVSLRAPSKSNIPFLKRINSLLLPVAYPDNFYRDILQQPESEALTRLAFYDEDCVGGIRCRVETEAEYKAGMERLRLKIHGEKESRILRAALSERSDQPGPQTGGERAKAKVYIMTLAVLSPYRSLSIGSHLVEYILATAVKNPMINADEVYAHVWVANEGALEFYRKLGFDVTSGAVIPDYYRRLEPHDAKIVFRKIAS